MKTPQIKFFSPEDNTEPVSKAAGKAKPKPSGYISDNGTLVFPKATLEEIGVEPETALFKVGTAEGKRKIKSLYLISTEEQEGAFAFARIGRGSGIALSVILKRGGIDYEAAKHVFTVTIFNYTEGVVGYELAIEIEAPKELYTGKPRGRKRKVTEEEAAA
ncbi:hypothetical protein GCM10007423_39340 [Dyadobacter endophyticus]|uniref:dUTPase-like domain-containing protein n=1 Tax=Dyadobacter endophyticus TaxID=1749036 RepID=A0ABQ1YXS5_9BACT|nr:hypothetical protein [Dyadobacter endophyticus]GGH42604.1 hypothetical protein GCM10007423_39340 [Dyadobacter endophyticus]